MPTFLECSVIQSGDLGGDGISRYHWVTGTGDPATDVDVDAFRSGLQAMYTALKTHVPPSITFDVSAEALEREVASGELVRVVGGTETLTPIQGAATEVLYPAGMGARINWGTGMVINGRRLRGATYIVPLDGGAYTNQGGVNEAAMTALTAGVAALQAAVDTNNLGLVVYHRPAKGATVGGVIGQVVTYKINHTPASLRSRRV